MADQLGAGARSAHKAGGAHRVLAWRWLIAALLLLAVATWAAWQQTPIFVPVGGTPRTDSLWMRFWKPLETNPHRRLVTVPRALSSIAVAGQRSRAWVVGDKGLILVSANRGETWTTQTSGTTNRLLALSVLPDGTHAWAVGTGGTILATNDGGDTWTAQTSTTRKGVTAISVLPDTLRGWALADNGTILATDNGGKTWAAQTSGVTSALWGLSVLPDGRRAWAVGEKGTILTTSDGGTTWAAQDSSTSSELRAISALPDGKHAWAVGDGGTILATSDGGNTWTRQTSTTDQTLQALSVSPDGLHAWAVGWEGTVLTTADGGKTWAAQAIPNRAIFTSVSVLPDGLTAWVADYGGSILTTTDGGRTWAAQTGEATGALEALSVRPDRSYAWAVADDGRALATTDGGTTWASQASASKNIFSAISASADGLHAWAVAYRSILATSNGGVTWTTQASLPSQYFTAIHVLPDGLHGWAVGDKGIVWATTDGGTTWATQSSATTNRLNAVDAHPDGLHAWAVGDGGTIVATTDGGNTWTARDSSTQSWLSAIRMLPDGLHGWVAGSGTILVTADGGTSWSAKSHDSKSRISAISGLPDGLHAWAVGSGGAILVTTDGGTTWVTQNSTTGHNLSAIGVLPDGLHAWAVGARRTILATTDGGATWSNAEHYSRSPAPWYWLVVALAAALAWQSWRLRPNGASQESVAGVAASDAEVRSAADDRLAFSGLARGISRFLRNTETRPPLTLAITGDWGSGKSSLMQLVCADLRRFGHRPIWFNAWHHQKEEHLFAALLGAIHAQAAPPLCTPNGIAFRLRLLWLRSKQRLGVMVLMVGVVAFLLVLSWGAFQRGGFPSVTLMLAALHDSAAAQLATLTALGAAVSGLLTLFKGAAVFGVNPALLLTQVRSGMSIKTAAAQNDFRAQFAQQFGELVQALPYRLVIVIDDLDRCRPAAVLDVMETVNYLTSAGECFVIFGMASERVQAALGLAFKDIAAELVNMDISPTSDAESAAAATDLALAKRRAYASDYLQKLVNIEIKVPTAQNQAAHQLLQASEPVRRRQVQAVFAGLWQLWPLAAAVLAAAIGVWAATSVAPPSTTPVTPAATIAVAVPPAAQPPSSAVAPPKPLASDAVAAQPPAQNDALAPSVQAGDTVPALSVLAWLALALLPMAGIATWIVLRLLRKTLQETRDSPRFREALEIWTGVVAHKRATPRAIKRFGNRLRYLAMLQQGESLDTTWRDELAARWRRRQGPAAATPPSSSDALAEHQLIAIGALYEVHGKNWKEKIQAFATQDWYEFLDDGTRPDEAAAQAFADAVRQHQNKFDVAWPPSPDELAVFERLISGVRLAGDPRTLAPSAREAEPEMRSESSVSGSYPA